jgi:hypothetical protein
VAVTPAAASFALRRVDHRLEVPDGDHCDVHQPRLRAQRQDLAEHAGQRTLMALDEACDRGVIGL